MTICAINPLCRSRPCDCATWYGRVPDDIERPPGPGYRDYIRPDNPSHDRSIPLDDFLAVENADAPPVLAQDAIPLWEGPYDRLFSAMHHFRFDSQKDRAIVRRLCAGQTWREVTKALGVGRDRIVRVLRHVRAWEGVS